MAFILEAIQNNVCITFRFHEYDAEKQLIPRRYEYYLSPYHIVVYHDQCYLIGNMLGKDNLSHYRIDLMTELAVYTDAEGEPVKRVPMSKFKELKTIRGTWDPVKYMSEHLYMGWEPPRPIQIKIRNNQ